MSSQKPIYDARFLKQFTLAILKGIEKNKFNITQPKVIVDADLIPELSEEISKELVLGDELLKRLQSLQGMNFLEPNPLPNRKLSQPQQKRVKQVGVPQKINPAIKNKAPEQTLPETAGNGYQLIMPLLTDTMVSRIQCIGQNKPLIIIRAGQRTVTKIALSQKQIHDVFQEVAEQAHIPLIEGPFKVLLENLEMEGMNARITDSKFVIQKKTAYSMLEKSHKESTGHMPERRSMPMPHPSRNAPSGGMPQRRPQPGRLPPRR